MTDDVSDIVPADLMERPAVKMALEVRQIGLRVDRIFELKPDDSVEFYTAVAASLRELCRQANSAAKLAEEAAQERRR